MTGNLALDEGMKIINNAVAGELKQTKHINVQFLPEEDCAFIRTYKGGRFTNTPGEIWAWEEHLSGGDEW